jgi:hypothetical protein
MNCTVEINLPLYKVIELFFDKAHFNFNEWKKYFVRHEHVSGIPNEIGSVDKLAFKRVTLIEIVTS